MIKAKHDGQYKQVGFIKVRQPDGTYKDVEKKYGKTNGEYGLVFEKGFTREAEGALPLTLSGIGKPLKDCTIEGNTYQPDGVSPDTPQEVVGCGDRTGNLINTNTIVKGRLDDGILGYEEETTELIVSGNIIKCTTTKPWRGFVTDFTPVEQGRYYLYHIMTPSDITYTYRMSVYDSQKNFIRVTAQSERTITINEGEAFIRVSYQLGVAGTFEISNIMLNAGSTPLPYEPYGYKVDGVTRGKNLFDKTTATEGKRVTTTGLATSTEDFASDYISVSAGETYTVYGLAGLTTTIYFYNSNDVLLSYFATNTAVSATFVIPDEASKLRFTGVLSLLDIAQLELGTEATEYEPYTPPITTPIYLDSPLYKIGDYADVRGMTEEVRAVKELVLTGEETGWRQEGASGGRSRYSLPLQYGLLSDLGQPTSFCTHLQLLENGGTWKTDNGYTIAIGTGNVPTLYVRLTADYDNYSDFIAWLKSQYSAGTPVTVYYVLAEPESKAVEPVEIPTLNRTTVIDIDTEVKPSNVYIKYKSKT